MPEAYVVRYNSQLDGKNKLQSSTLWHKVQQSQHTVFSVIGAIQFHQQNYAQLVQAAKIYAQLLCQMLYIACQKSNVYLLAQKLLLKS